MADKIRTMKKRITNKMLLFLAFCSLTACQSYYYDETKELKAAVWTYQNPINFDFKIEDTTTVYNIYLEVEHSAEFPNQNIYAKVHVRFPDGKDRQQQVSLELADGRGEWLGKCSAKTCTRRLAFMPNAVFDQAGAYSMKFEQYTRNESVEGIKSLRLIVEKAKIDKEEKNTKKDLKK